MKKRDLLPIFLGTACACAAIVFSIPSLIPFSDEKTGALVQDAVPRLMCGGFVFLLILFYGEKKLLAFPRRILWGLPCLMVALVNFPYTALISGSARVERIDLLWLFLLKCAGIALLEEGFFRGILYPFLRERFSGKLPPVLISAAAFGLIHLLNLFYGAGVGATFLQVGYTFLLGCMFAVLLDETGSIWPCVLCHFLFDIGGTLIPELGSGPFQDIVFWILTACAGVLCAVHVIVTLFRKNPAK